jgi:hypothetical protein
MTRGDPADPLQDVRALESVGFVMKAGQVVKDELARHGRPVKAE